VVRYLAEANTMSVGTLALLVLLQLSLALQKVYYKDQYPAMINSI
jgi:hypothetical protein